MGQKKRSQMTYKIKLIVSNRKLTLVSLNGTINGMNWNKIDPIVKPTPDRHLIRITLRLPEKVKKRLDAICRKKKKSLNSMIVHLVIKGFRA